MSDSSLANEPTGEPSIAPAPYIYPKTDPVVVYNDSRYPAGSLVTSASATGIIAVILILMMVGVTMYDKRRRRRADQQRAAEREACIAAEQRLNQQFVVVINPCEKRQEYSLGRILDDTSLESIPKC